MIRELEPMVLEEHVRAIAAHYARLQRTPGWKDYAQDRVRRMTAETHGLWRDLPRLVQEAMKESN